MTSSSRKRGDVPAAAGASAAKPSPYARFIPREELNSFAAWNPGSLADGSGASHPAGAAGDDTGRHDAAGRAAEDVRAARQTGYQDGYRDGLVALDGFKQSFAQQATAQVGALLRSIDVQLDALQQEMAQAVTETAVRLARQIVRSELRHRPEAVADVAREAIDALLLSARHITLRVHPDDQPLVADGAGDVLAARGARLVADAGVARGGCIVESDIGLIDASLETRWRRAVSSVGRDDAWREVEPAPVPTPRAAP